MSLIAKMFIFNILSPFLIEKYLLMEASEENRKQNNIM